MAVIASHPGVAGIFFFCFRPQLVHPSKKSERISIHFRRLPSRGAGLGMVTPDGFVGYGNFKG
jgi:hypothetical protein